jgi:hypothetical protein
MFQSCVKFLRSFHIAGAKIQIEPLTTTPELDLTPQDRDPIHDELLLYYLMVQEQR